jgi:UDP-GlcNAc:undecaprenyl-phosphate GlcNAc-1-phosphate transferase
VVAAGGNVLVSTSSWFVGWIAFALALTVSVVATPVVRSLAIRMRLGDKPNGRKLHAHPIPHLGGVALFLGVFAAIAPLGSQWLPAGASTSLLLKAIPAVLVIVVLGLVDDTRNLRARHKLVVQVLAAIMLVAIGFRLFTGVWIFDVSSVVVALVSLVFIVGMLSSVNLVDGHDGLAGGISFLSAAAFATIGAVAGISDVVPLSLAVCGACLGFLVFNFPPGRIYMGDTGSMLLGLLLALTACLVSMRAPSANMFAAVCFVLGVPLLDTALAISRRVVLRSPLFTADCLHMHHVLRDSGLSPRKTLLILYGMQIFFCLLGVGAAMGWVLPVIVGLGFVSLVYVSFLRLMIEERTTAAAVPARHMAANTIPFQSKFTPGLQERRTSVGQ